MMRVPMPIDLMSEAESDKAMTIGGLFPLLRLAVAPQQLGPDMRAETITGLRAEARKWAAEMGIELPQLLAAADAIERRDWRALAALIRRATRDRLAYELREYRRQLGMHRRVLACVDLVQAGQFAGAA